MQVISTKQFTIVIIIIILKNYLQHMHHLINNG